VIMLAGCIAEKEPNNTVAEADANNVVLLFPVDNSQPHGVAPRADTYFGNAEANGNDNWIIYMNGQTSPNNLTLVAHSPDNRCLTFKLYYCNVLANSWEDCGQKLTLSPVFACDNFDHFSTTNALAAGHFLRVEVVGAPQNANYNFTFPYAVP
jgi:hypothetical protein